jgi:TNF receptor-associated protein 1
MSTETTEKHSFQAEVQQLLDIVIHSLYTDKEIFVRELVSNASDALEKLRLRQLTDNDVFDPKLEPEITITTNEEEKTITIADSGIGMTREELIENLGTIAHSGSKAFLKALNESGQKESNLIGQFGVGFYSAFMVSDAVTVYTHSWKEDGEHLCWKSDGKTGYEIEEAPGQRRGCQIVIKLKDECDEFAKESRIRGILEQYSSFVPFPVNLNGERVNKIEALWLKNKKEVTDDEYEAFYKFTANTNEAPRFHMHFSADAPIAINSLVFVPMENPERFATGQVDPGVALYCRKVLIASQPKGLLPDWLRFLKGVIDSEDLPLNISRETMQDSALVRKLNQLITKRFLKFLEGEASDAEKYAEFYKRFSRFLKEGAVMDFAYREQLSELLRFESSFEEEGKLTSLQAYLDRAKDGQDVIYYQIGGSREAIEAAPYLEAFKARGLEVLYLFDAIDDYLMGSLSEFKGKRLVAIDRDDVKLEDLPEDSAAGEPLADEDFTKLCEWIKEQLGDKVEEVRKGTRLIESPAMALNADPMMTPQLRHMMASMGQETPPSRVHLELNPRHGLVKRIAAAREKSPELAKLVAEQILDNSMIAAGLLEDSRDLVQRVYRIMELGLGE